MILDYRREKPRTEEYVKSSGRLDSFKHRYECELGQAYCTGYLQWQKDLAEYCEEVTNRIREKETEEPFL